MLVIRFLAVLFTGLTLIAPGAHLFELLNTITLPADQYFVVQGIYRGWWIAGLPLPAAFLANVALAVAARHDTTGSLSCACGRGAGRRQPRDLLHVDSAGQCGHRQLDDPSGQLGDLAPAMGVFARGEYRRDAPRLL
jgi:hypothetical protein